MGRVFNDGGCSDGDLNTNHIAQIRPLKSLCFSMQPEAISDASYIAYVKQGNVYSIYLNNSVGNVTTLVSQVTDSAPDLPTNVMWTMNGRRLLSPAMRGELRFQTSRQENILCLEHPDLGRVGPVPFWRTGGHTGLYGMAYLKSDILAPGDYGTRSSFDVVPTLFHLLNEPLPNKISGQSLV